MALVYWKGLEAVNMANELLRMLRGLKDKELRSVIGYCVEDMEDDVVDNGRHRRVIATKY